MIEDLRNSIYYKLLERSDATNPKSLQGAGPYGPYGPEAAI
jgi:hypothetical protein